MLMRPPILADGRHYLKQCPELARGRMTPLEHFIVSGEASGINPHPLFDIGYFRRQTSRAPVPDTTSSPERCTGGAPSSIHP